MLSRTIGAFVSENNTAGFEERTRKRNRGLTQSLPSLSSRNLVKQDDWNRDGATDK